MWWNTPSMTLQQIAQAPTCSVESGGCGRGWRRMTELRARGGGARISILCGVPPPYQQRPTGCSCHTRSTSPGLSAPALLGGLHPSWASQLKQIRSGSTCNNARQHICGSAESSLAGWLERTSHQSYLQKQSCSPSLFAFSQMTIRNFWEVWILEIFYPNPNIINILIFVWLPPVTADSSDTAIN